MNSSSIRPFCGLLLVGSFLSLSPTANAQRCLPCPPPPGGQWIQTVPVPSQAPPSTGAQTTPSATTPGADTSATNQQSAQAPDANQDSERSGAAGGETTAVATPNLIGDLILPPVNTPPSSSGSGSGNSSSGRGPGVNGSFTTADRSGTARLFRGAFKITDNESPRPRDRVYITYNYYNNVGAIFNQPGQRQLDIHREVLGFEKTFLDGDASFSVRGPWIEMAGQSHDSGIGDLSAYLKFALINDRDTGNCFSTGLMVTAPVSKFVETSMAGEDVHATLLQPFIGYIYKREQFFVQGFSSVIVPTDTRDVTILFNDVSFGYEAYRNPNRDSLLTSVTPVFELHMNDPLNHRGAFGQPVGISDILVLTAGSHIGLGRGSMLTFGVGTPVTGPKPFTVEGVVQFNYNF